MLDGYGWVTLRRVGLSSHSRRLLLLFLFFPGQPDEEGFEIKRDGSEFMQMPAVIDNGLRNLAGDILI